MNSNIWHTTMCSVTYDMIYDKPHCFTFYLQKLLESAMSMDATEPDPNLDLISHWVLMGTPGLSSGAPVFIQACD